MSLVELTALRAAASSVTSLSNQKSPLASFQRTRRRAWGGAGGTGLCLWRALRLNGPALIRAIGLLASNNRGGFQCVQIIKTSQMATNHVQAQCGEPTRREQERKSHPGGCLSPTHGASEKSFRPPGGFDRSCRVAWGSHFHVLQTLRASAQHREPGLPHTVTCQGQLVSPRRGRCCKGLSASSPSLLQPILPMAASATSLGLYVSASTPPL